MIKKRILSMLVLLAAVVTGAWAQTGMTNGLFSVSATKRVYFSKGNLQLVGENTFQFAENQWDYFGSNQSDNHRDLFSWGTGNNPNQTTGNSTFTDWGDNTYLQATLGKGWRTMTKDEFVYVFNNRASGSSVFGNANGRYTTATINTDDTGVKGLILFPDGITIAASEVTTAGTINSKGTVTQCTKAQWAALAEKGCVFLPAAGYFLPANGAGAGYGDITDYWSSTAANASNAYNLSFNFGYSGAVVNTAGSLGYKYGCSVRLVIDGITLDKNEAQMTIGNAMTLTATVVTPTGDKTVTWTTSDASVATVADGVVTAVAAGTATITATATNGTADTGDDVSATCAVTVNPAVTGVTLSATEATMTVGGETLTLTATVSPDNATDKTVTWTTSDAGVCTVTDGVVTAVGLGTATITVTATNGTADPSDDVTATCTVTVATPINAVSEDGTIGAFTDANGQTRMGIVVTLNGNKYAISMNEETDLSGLSGTYTKKVGSHTYYNQADACKKFANNKSDGSYNVANVWRLPTATEMSYLVALGGTWDGTEGHQGYTWTIGSNSLFLPAAGYNDNGGVQNSDWGYYWTSGGGTGNMLCFTSWYTARIGNGGTSSGMPLRLFCQLPYTAVTGVTLSPTEASLIVGGETLTLTATVSPDNATDKSVTWSSSNEAVATVSNEGVVTAVAAGEATIIVTTTDGAFTATCTVTVAEPTYTVTLKEGTLDADNWEINPANAASGTEITLKYNGKKKVKNITIEKAAE